MTRRSDERKEDAYSVVYSRSWTIALPPSSLPAMDVEDEAGPSRQRSLSHDDRPSRPNRQHSRRDAPIQAIPSTNFIHIEYPGLFQEASPTSTASESGSRAHAHTQQQLHRALQTLSPHPPPYNNVGTALDHLGRLVSLQSKAIECRLGSWTDSPSLGNGKSKGSQKDQDGEDQRTTRDIYRHPIVGELVETHDLVALVRRRVWTRRKKRKRNPTNGEVDIEGISEQSSSSSQEETFREYSVDVLGPVKSTARWRKMADFNYDPHLPADDEKDKLVDVPGRPNERGGILTLHDALARMDVASLRSFSIPEQSEEDSANGAHGRNDIRAIPPPLFSRMDIPFPYGFRQPSMSYLQSYQHRLPDGTTVESQRWLNAGRWKGLAPWQWSLKSNEKPPTEPPSEVTKLRSRCDPKVLAKLQEIFEARPVWTRTALMNQLPDENMRRAVMFTKEYVPLFAYTVTDGAWRDSLVKLGYDLRESNDSRFYQKVSFQLPTATSHKGKGSFKAAYGGAHHSGAGAHTARQAQAVESGGREQASPDDDTEAAETQTERQPTTTDTRDSHKFDGETLNRSTGTFTLCDIVDPLVQPYILAEGPENILDRPTAETGWYTGEAFERIKTAVGVRYRHLLEHNGTPATREDVWKAIEGMVTRKAQRERKERSHAVSVAALSAMEDDDGDEGGGSD